MMIKKLYETIHRNKKTVEQIADEMGISANLLYRYGYDGETGADFPLKRLIPLMKATNNYKLLKHIANLCGFVCVKIPRAKATKKDDFELREEYQEVTSKAQRALKEFFARPTEDNYINVKQSLHDVMEKSAAAGKYADKVFKGQLEMEL